MRILIFIISILGFSITNAEELKFNCLIENGSNLLKLAIDTKTGTMTWGGDETFKVFQQTEKWISAYRYTDWGTGVGTGSVVFNRDTLIMQFSDIAHTNYPPGTDEIHVSNYKAQCKK